MRLASASLRKATPEGPGVEEKRAGLVRGKPRGHAAGLGHDARDARRAAERHAQVEKRGRREVRDGMRPERGLGEQRHAALRERGEASPPPCRGARLPPRNASAAARRRGRRRRFRAAGPSGGLSPRPDASDLLTGRGGYRIVPRGDDHPPFVAQAHAPVGETPGSRRKDGAVRRVGHARRVFRSRRRAPRRADARRPLRRLAHGRDPGARAEGVRDRAAPHVQRRRGARRRQGPVLGLPHRAGHVRRRPSHVPDRPGRLPPRRERGEHAEGRRVGEAAGVSGRGGRGRVADLGAARAPGAPRRARPPAADRREARGRGRTTAS